MNYSLRPGVPHPLRLKLLSKQYKSNGSKVPASPVDRLQIIVLNVLLHLCALRYVYITMELFHTSFTPIISLHLLFLSIE